MVQKETEEKQMSFTFGTAIIIVGLFFMSFGMFELKETTFGYFSIMSAFGLTWCLLGVLCKEIEIKNKKICESFIEVKQ